MSIVTICISKMPGADIKSMQPKLINIFIEAFDYRIISETKVSAY